MKTLIKTDIPIVVEGKYDKIALENVVDAYIITTDGFQIFKDKQKASFLRRLAKDKGIIIVTDSDSAGAIIRSYIKNICADCKIINVYIPQLKGKEKRKTSSSAEGFLGVEGMSVEVLENAFKRSGVGILAQDEEKESRILKKDLFNLGLSGGNNSAVLRKRFSEFAKIPTGLSSNAFLDVLNAIYTYDEFMKAVILWQQEADKN